MHGFFLIGLAGGLLHATALAVIGFFVLFAASRATGALARLGQALGIWLFILAVLAIIGGALIGPRIGHFHHGMMGHGGWGPPPAAAPAAPPPAAAAPANAAPGGK